MDDHGNRPGPSHDPWSWVCFAPSPCPIYARGFRFAMLTVAA